MRGNSMDVTVVGGGPAGLAAACAAYDCGLDVALVDEQPNVGGQLFRQVEEPPAPELYNASERRTGLELAERFHAARITWYSRAVVWEAGPRHVCYTVGEDAFKLSTACTILAPGGMERPVPFPGWTLPGVMGAGGADILLRSGGTLPGLERGPVVLVGNGPLLLLLACHLLHAGVSVAAWLDTGRLRDRLRGVAALPAALLDMPYMLKGLGMAWRIVRGRIPLFCAVHDVRAEGENCLERITFTSGKTRHTLQAAVLLRHEGIIPRTHLAAAAGVPLAWDVMQRYWRPKANAHGRTVVNGLYLAGDAAHIHGGEASILKGTLAGVEAARMLGVINAKEAQRRAAPVQRQLRRLLAARFYLRLLFAPAPHIFHPPDDTVVCRCEGVSAGDIRKAAAEQFCHMDEIKRATRCGMGMCQGRMCGQAAAEIAARTLNLPVPAVGTLHVRAPVRPVRLEQYCHAHENTTTGGIA